MQVILLMAGTGSRLLPLTHEKPKSLITIKNKQTIFDYQANSLLNSGNINLLLVVGYKKNSIVDKISHVKNKFNITYIENHSYRIKNMDWSIYLALTKSKGDILYYEGDVILEKKLIGKIRACKSDICLLYSSSHMSNKVDSLLKLTNGEPVIILKEHNHFNKKEKNNSLGELICVMKISDSAKKFIERNLPQFDFKGRMIFYDILNIAIKLFKTTYIDASKFSWIEIDSIQDLQTARNTKRLKSYNT